MTSSVQEMVAAFSLRNAPTVPSVLTAKRPFIDSTKIRELKCQLQGVNNSPKKMFRPGPSVSGQSFHKPVNRQPNQFPVPKPVVSIPKKTLPKAVTDPNLDESAKSQVLVCKPDPTCPTNVVEHTGVDASSKNYFDHKMVKSYKSAVVILTLALGWLMQTFLWRSKTVGLSDQKQVVVVPEVKYEPEVVLSEFALNTPHLYLLGLGGLTYVVAKIRQAYDRQEEAKARRLENIKRAGYIVGILTAFCVIGSILMATYLFSSMSAADQKSDSVTSGYFFGDSSKRKWLMPFIVGIATFGMCSTGMFD